MVVVKGQLIVIGIICVLTFKIIADTNNISKFTRFMCNVYDKQLFANVTCTLKSINRNKTVINLESYITRPVNPIKVNIRLYKKLNLQYKPFLVNVVENVCHLFSKESSVPYTKILVGIARMNTNINHACPYSGILFVRNLPMDASKLRDMWPTGEYRVDIGVFVNNSSTLVGLIQVFIDMREKRFIQ